MERRFVKTYSQHLTCDSKILIHLVAVATCFNLIGCVALFSCPKRVLCVIGQYFTIITVMYSVLFTSCWKLISKYSLYCLNIALFDYVLIHTPLSLNQKKSSCHTSLHGFIFISGVQEEHATKFYDVVFTFEATKYMKTSHTYLP